MKRILLFNFFIIYSGLIFSQWQINSAKNSYPGICMTYFVNKDIGFAAGGSNNYFGKTIDGGKTWTQVSSIGIWDMVGDMYFYDSNIGLMGGQNVGIKKTTDGGKTWNSVYTQGLCDFEVVGNTIYAATFNGVEKTTNVGDTWQNIFNTEKVCSISFKDAQNGVLATGSNKIYLTSNGGETWTYKSSIETGAYGNSISSISYFSNNNIVIISVNGYPSEEYLYKSINNGSSWVKETIVKGTGYPRLDNKGNVGLLIYGWNGIKYTIDGGNTWINQSHSSPQVFYDCQIIDNNSAVIAGSYDLVLKNDNINFYFEGSDYINGFFKNDTIPLPQSSDTLKLSITTPYNWNATTDQNWVKIINPTGSNGLLNILIQNNLTSCHRFAEVRLSGDGFNTKSLIIDQEGKNFFIEGQDTINRFQNVFYFFNQNITERTFKINACKKWKINNNCDWAIITPDSGVSSSNVILKLKTFELSKSPTKAIDSYRATELPIIYDGDNKYPETILIYQKGTFTPTLNVSDNKIIISPEIYSIGKLYVNTNIQWMANSDQDWLVAGNSLDSGNQYDTLYVVALSENTGLNSRIGTVTLSSAGVQSVTITVTQLGSLSLNNIISTFANPIAGGATTGSGSFVSGSSKTVTATANTGYTFTNWTENGTEVSNSASYTFTLSANRILVANFTPSTSLRDSRVQNASLHLAPNPAKIFVKISSSENLERIDFYDLSARMVRSEVVNAEKRTLNISSLKKGIYIIKGYSNGKVFVQRLIKE